MAILLHFLSAKQYIVRRSVLIDSEDASILITVDSERDKTAHAYRKKKALCFHYL